MDRTLSGLGLVFMILVLIAFLYNEYREGYRPVGPYYTGQSASVYGAYNGYNQGIYNPSYNYYGGSYYRMPMSFGECAAMGFPVGESYPRRCFTRDYTFVETVTTYTNTRQNTDMYSSYDTTYSY